MLNRKVTIIHLIVGLIKRYCYIKVNYFPAYGHSKNKIAVQVNFSNYAMIKGAKIKDVEDKIPSVTNLATNAVLNAKINEVKGIIKNINNLATTDALTTVENKISDHSKYMTSPEFSKLTVENVTVKLKQANLVTKEYITDFVKIKIFDDKLKYSNE